MALNAGKDKEPQIPIAGENLKWDRYVIDNVIL